MDWGRGKLAQVCFLSHSSTQANPKVVFLCRAKEVKQACSEFKMTSVIFQMEAAVHEQEGKNLSLYTTASLGAGIPGELASLGSFGCSSRTHMATGSLSSLLQLSRGEVRMLCLKELLPYVNSEAVFSLSWTGWMTNPFIHSSPVQALPCPLCMCKSLC